MHYKAPPIPSFAVIDAFRETATSKQYQVQPQLPSITMRLQEVFKAKASLLEELLGGHAVILLVGRLAGVEIHHSCQKRHHGSPVC